VQVNGRLLALNEYIASVDGRMREFGSKLSEKSGMMSLLQTELSSLQLDYNAVSAENDRLKAELDRLKVSSAVITQAATLPVCMYGYILSPRQHLTE
jgi:DNA repair exonuclease SbcCD ATPase subunit